MFKLVSLNSFMGNYNVILTCRNSEKIIEPSLTSIIEQSIKPKYIIVVDDGSTDSTPNILKQIQKMNNNKSSVSSLLLHHLPNFLYGYSDIASFCSSLLV